MRYITEEEQELYEKIAEKYKIKGYTMPNSLACSQPLDRNKELHKQDKKNKGAS